jgi:YidC/Oxa1 family membrane protein insertase
MNFLFDGIASALSFFYDITSSYGGAIILLTLGVMVIVTPLTLKSTRSMIAMQQLQPELRKLQVKYKDDRQKLNEEMMAFYKEHNINPMGGCLPLLVQMPVFIVLYRVLHGLTQMQPYGHDMGVAWGTAARNPASGGLYEGYGTFDPQYLDHSSKLYTDLASSRQMEWLNLDLASTFTQQMRNGIVDALPYLVLVLLIAVTAWYQQRQIQARNAGQQSQINPQQQALMKIMPFFLPIFSLTLPAGLVLYFLVSNLYRIAQQAFITHTMYSEKAKADREKQAADRAKASATRDGGGNGKGGTGKPKGGPKADDEPLTRADTVPTGSRGLLGGLIQLPAKPSADTSDRGSDERARTTTTTATKSPSRKAPARPPAPTSQNRSKKKKKRK